MSVPLINLKKRGGRYSGGEEDPRIQLMKNAKEKCPGVETALIDAISENKKTPVSGFNPYSKCLELCQQGCDAGSVDCNYLCGEVVFDDGPANNPTTPSVLPPGGIQYTTTPPSLGVNEKNILDDCIKNAKISSRTCKQDVLNCCATAGKYEKQASDYPGGPTRTITVYPMMEKPGFMEYCATLADARCNPTTTTTTRAPSSGIVVNPSFDITTTMMPTTMMPTTMIPTTMMPTTMMPTTMMPTTMMPTTMMPTTMMPTTMAPEMEPEMEPEMNPTMAPTNIESTFAPDITTTKQPLRVVTTPTPSDSSAVSDSSANCSSENSDCKFFKNLLKFLLFAAGLAILILLIVELNKNNKSSATGIVPDKIIEAPMARPVAFETFVNGQYAPPGYAYTRIA